jgi:hypothetical protein
MIETVCPQCLGETIGYRPQDNGCVEPVCANGCSLSKEDKFNLTYSIEFETVRPVTRRLITNIMFDLPLYTLTPAVLTDFELTEERYLRLYHLVRSNAISPKTLDEALGQPEKLETLYQSGR